MIVTNKIYNSFGPISFAGKLIFIFGCGTVWFSPYAVFLIFGGAFIGFTYCCTSIDVDNRAIRSGDVLFGMFKTGFWLNVKPDMTIGLQRAEEVWRIYSLSNRILKTRENNFLIVLFNSRGKKLFPLNKATSKESANNELYRLSDLLNIRTLHP
jgi:hypothetical protein